MHRFFLCLLFICSAYAQVLSDAEKQSYAFMQTFMETCGAFADDQDALRAALRTRHGAQIKSEAAKSFNAGMKGEVWHIPAAVAGKNFILFFVLDKNYCMLYADETDVAQTERLFMEYVHMPEKENIFEVIKREDTHQKSAMGIDAHFMSYEWKKPNSARGIVLSLSTSPSIVQISQAFIRHE